MAVVIFAAFSLATSVKFQCDFRNRNYWLTLNEYSCIPAALISDGNLSHVFDVTGNHSSGKTNEDVKGFEIESNHQHLNRIPKGIEKFFPNLIAFVWYDGNLTTLIADDLKPFPKLQLFSALINKLVSVDGYLFKHTPTLKVIYLNVNLLENVGFGLLDGLNNLTNAYFQNNSCIHWIANSPATIQELNLKLRNQCPPLASMTTSPTTSSTSLAPSTTLASTTTIGTSTECPPGKNLSTRLNRLLDPFVFPFILISKCAFYLNVFEQF